jgi:hypothetical protein
MSTINTNPINVNYPVPGVNNNSQGFRDNFASIKNNLDIAGTELTDLQNKVVVKQALTGTTINNDMANTLISNALTRGFRATTYNLGGALAGNVLVDTSLADVQYGTVAANTTINFGSWAPTGTQSSVQLRLGVSNPNAVITFSGNVAVSNNTGATTLENFVANGSSLTVTAPYGVTEMDYLITTIDCGTNLYIEPLNRPRISTQVQQRTPAPTGFQGDLAGDVAVDSTYAYVCTGTFNSGGANTLTRTATASYSSNNEVVLSSVGSGLAVNKPIIFTGTTFGNITANTVYYVKSIVGGNSSITLSATRTSGTAGSTFVLTNGSGTCTATSYNGSDIWKRIALTSW